MLSAYMKGDCGLLFTNKPKEEILKYSFLNYIFF